MDIRFDVCLYVLGLGKSRTRSIRAFSKVALPCRYSYSKQYLCLGVSMVMVLCEGNLLLSARKYTHTHTYSTNWPSDFSNERAQKKTLMANARRCIIVHTQYTLWNTFNYIYELHFSRTDNNGLRDISQSICLRLGSAKLVSPLKARNDVWSTRFACSLCVCGFALD